VLPALCSVDSEMKWRGQDGSRATVARGADAMRATAVLRWGVGCTCVTEHTSRESGPLPGGATRCPLPASLALSPQQSSPSVSSRAKARARVERMVADRYADHSSYLSQEM
jgi:hypothetical protein